MPAATLHVNGLSSGYGRTVIVEDVSFSVPAGQRMAIIGRNGMGKTTLLSTLMGLTTHHAGTIAVEGAGVEKLSASRRAYAGLGYVPQTRDIFRTLTVEENLVSGLKGRAKTNLDEAYHLFPRLRERRRNLGWQLSGGEQQMLSTARALLGKPSVLLLDEPLEGLAPVICQELMAAFTELAKAGTTTILLVEQNLKTALAFAEEVLVMERGRIVWSGQSEALSSEPHLIDKFMGVAGVH
ncbi:ABC transporter ATP-binding protein [Tianweitania sediminis]|jgi:branched-chain amino acid transport system ATP-binding protein|uniref:ABC transporter ATP-binding protein n=1 Tax=Tianweitania sediminis TaxID=1502156 RepID=A0A8J7QZ66_9HYPH|nr:ABC transporter ATP-binding protein [Tianweitania sediminis]MBP0438695.1 ABC transporter ATP-binding protein [Tianweitania sediminis]